MTKRVIFAVMFMLAAFSLHAAAFGPEFRTANVIKVFDGDTILVRVDGAEEKVRFIGIDCPEAVYNEKFERDLGKNRFMSAVDMIELGKKAKEFTAAACPAGSTVKLEMDEEERDKYGRLLAYVWVTGKGAPGREYMLNSRLVRKGLAWVMPIPPNTRHATEFANLQKEAKDNMAGIWSY